MYLVINGTNRHSSLSKPVSAFVFEYLKSKFSDQVKFLDLCEIRMNAFESESMYNKEKVSEVILDIRNSLLVPASKMIFVSPEYNGSFPGILKLFLDAASIKDAKEAFFHKKACLIGIASGRAGNLRGMDHLTGVLMYMNMIVYPNRLPISRIETLIDNDRKLNDENTVTIISNLLDEFIQF